MLGIFATIAWAIAYWLLASRGAGLVSCVIAGLAVFAVIGTAVRELTVGPFVLYVALVVVLLVTIRLIPPSPPHAGVELPWWDLPGRMLLATALVLTITGSATVLGPRLAGRLATIPPYASILPRSGPTLARPRTATAG